MKPRIFIMAALLGLFVFANFIVLVDFEHPEPWQSVIGMNSFLVTVLSLAAAIWYSVEE